MEHLEDLVRERQEYEERLLQWINGGPERRCPWNWPLELLEPIRERTEKINPLVRKTLDKLVEYPDKRSANPNLFYNGDFSEQFRRKTTWFSEMGFMKYETTYTVATTPDRQCISVMFLVPDNLKARDTPPIKWYFHGGGYCTGSNDYIPWYSRASLEHAHRSKAIIMAPNYPLAPEGTYRDVNDSLRAFLSFYKCDGCFEPGEKNWTKWLVNKIRIPDITLDKDRVMIEGESAGGDVACRTLFLNADKESGYHIPIRFILLHSTMAGHYVKAFPECVGNKPNYMDYELKKDDVQKQGQMIVDEILHIEMQGIALCRSKGAAPEFMFPALSLSSTENKHNLQWMLQRKHGLGKDQFIDQDHYANLDCLERAKRCADKVLHEYLPPITLLHGHDDSTCALHRAEAFVSGLREYYPSRYAGEALHLEVVYELQGAQSIPGTQHTEVGHAFGRDFVERDTQYLRDTYARADRVWLQS